MRPHGLGAMLLAFSVIFVLAWVFIVRQPPTPPAPTLGAVEGTYTWQSSTGAPAMLTGAGTFAAGHGGDARGTFAPRGGTVASVESSYEAVTRTERTTMRRDTGSETTVTVGAWPPAWRLATHSPLELQGLAAIVRAAVDDGDTAVGTKPLEQDGREVWRAAMTLAGTTMELVVDQRSGLVTWYSDGASTFSADVAWGTTPSFTPVPAPSGGTAGGAAGGAAPAVGPRCTYWPSLGAAGREVDMIPLVSDLAPDGYRLSAVATASLGGGLGAWLPVTPPASQSTAAVPLAPLQVLQLYTRGLTWFEVRQVAPPQSAWVQTGMQIALETARATGLSYEQAQIQYGAFAGSTASTWYAASGPVLLVGDARRAVYVTGALTRQELLSLAEGFEPLGAGGAASAAAPAASPAP